MFDQTSQPLKHDPISSINGSAHGGTAPPKDPGHPAGGATEPIQQPNGKEPLFAFTVQPPENTAAPGWEGVFAAPVDFDSAHLPNLKPAVSRALVLTPPPLTLPTADIRRAAWQATDQYESTAKRLAEEAVKAEPIRRELRRVVRGATACVQRCRTELDRRASSLSGELKDTPRWVRQQLPDNRFGDASPFAVRMFWGHAAVLGVLLVALLASSFFAIRRLLLDILGEGLATEILAFAIPMVVLTACLGKLPFLGFSDLSKRGLSIAKYWLFPVGVVVLVANIGLIGAQQVDLSLAIDFDLDGDGFGSLSPEPWYTQPSLRVGLLALVDLIAVIIVALMWKLHMRQAVRPINLPSEAHAVTNAAASNAINLLAALEGLQQQLSEVSELLASDLESHTQRILAALHAERFGFDQACSRSIHDWMNRS